MQATVQTGACAMGDSSHVNQFMQLFTRHEPALRAYILTLIPNWNDAQDVLQQTNSVLWEKFDQYQSESNFFAWACQIARYEVLHWRRGQSRDRLRFGEDFVAKVADDVESMQPELDRQQQALAYCVQKLPPKDRELTQARYLDDASVEAAANKVGRKVDAVYKALKRIRHSLLNCIKKQLESEATR